MLDELIQAIEQIANERPDFVYEKRNGMCFYAVEKNEHAVPDCIVGHALVKIGYSAEELIYQDGYFKDIVQSDLEWHDVFSRGQSEEQLLEKINFITLVQEYQDGQIPWGTALKRAQRDRRNA